MIPSIQVMIDRRGSHQTDSSWWIWQVEKSSSNYRCQSHKTFASSFSAL